jgi:hypothetical protein
MKRLALTLVTLIWLTGCATAQKPVPVIQACPKVPELELDAPELAYQNLIASFLSGSLVKPIGLKPPSGLVLPPMKK